MLTGATEIGSAIATPNPWPLPTCTPIAVDDVYTAAAGQPLAISAPGVLGNDTDPNGDPLTAILVTGVSHGTLTLNANGSFTYTPNAGYSGPDTFTYKANDGHWTPTPRR